MAHYAPFIYNISVLHSNYFFILDLNIVMRHHVAQIFLLEGTNGVTVVQKWSSRSKSLWVHLFVLEKKESRGVDDKFGGGNVITETLAASVVTSAKLQNTDILFQTPNFLQLVQEGGE